MNPAHIHLMLNHVPLFGALAVTILCAVALVAAVFILEEAPPRPRVPIDLRGAMAFAVAGLFASGETEIVGAECSAVSFPAFFDVLKQVIY